MSIYNLDKIFNPKRVVLIEITGEVDNKSRRVLKNLLSCGFHGTVYPLSSSVESVQGIPTYRDLGSLPYLPDLAIICTPAPDVQKVVQACGEAGIRGLLILSSGFREVGLAGQQLETELADVTKQFEHMRIVGPNSLGIIVPGIGLNASDAIAAPSAGNLAFISESQALSNSLLDWAADSGVGFSLFASIGTKLDVGFGDLIDYLGTDPKTRAIILYIQSLTHAKRFMSATRSFARSKPIVVYKAGRFVETARAAISHTGTMAGEDAVYAAAFERAGIVRVNELDDIFDVAELLASKRIPQGPRLAIAGNAGGPALIATDALLNRQGILAGLSAETQAQMDAILPAACTLENPIDLLDDATPERFSQATQILLADKNVDALLVIFANHPTADPLAIARVITDAMQNSGKPVLAAWMGGERVKTGIQHLNQSGVPVHTTPEQAVRAFMHLVSYARNLETLYETPREVPMRFAPSRKKISEQFRSMFQSRSRLNESEAKSLLKAYEIQVTDTHIVHSQTQAVELANQIGYPVVIKLLSSEITHKVDIGGVVLNLHNAQAVRSAFEQIYRKAEEQGIDHRVRSMTIQPMADVSNGLEMILGTKKDSTFGAIIMVGMGGIATGVYRDFSLGLPPLNERLARHMLESLRCWPMLQGYRGSPPINIDRLIEVMIRFSCLVADIPEIREFDINPLLTTPESVIALDAAAILENDVTERHFQRYEHLAICPYPDQHIRHTRLRDNTKVTFRPVRPEDEPLWHKLIDSSSSATIRDRFRVLFSHATHQLAIQHCVIDYERELAIVVETITDNERQLIGIAQLMADLNHESAEFALLVPDPWQGQGIGGQLLDYCLELAAGWGLSRIVAETDPANSRMLAIFRKRGFESEYQIEDDVVYLKKHLSETAQ